MGKGESLSIGLGRFGIVLFPGRVNYSFDPEHGILFTARGFDAVVVVVECLQLVVFWAFAAIPRRLVLRYETTPHGTLDTYSNIASAICRQARSGKVSTSEWKSRSL